MLHKHKNNWILVKYGKLHCKIFQTLIYSSCFLFLASFFPFYKIFCRFNIDAIKEKENVGFFVYLILKFSYHENLFFFFHFHLFCNIHLFQYIKGTDV